MPAKRRALLALLLGALTAIGPFTVDLYLPALPSVARSLQTTESLVQLTLAGTTLGLALGQLFVGTLSDTIGRRTPLIVATIWHVIAALICATAPTIEILIVSRVLMGISSAAGTVVSLAMVRDLFEGIPMIRMLSRLAMVSGLAPVFAPVIGSQLLLVVDWRGIFIVLAGYTLLIGICVLLWVKETLPRELRAPRGLRALGPRFATLLRDRGYVGLILIGGLVWGGNFAYLATSPFIIQSQYGFSATEFGLIFAVNSIGFVLAIQFGARLTRRFGAARVIVIGVSMQFLAAAAMLAAHLATAAAPGFLITLWVFVASVGLCLPCLQSLALAPHAAIAGTAASLMGACNFGGGGVVTVLVGALSVHDVGSMAGIMMGTSALGLAVLLAVRRPGVLPTLA